MTQNHLLTEIWKQIQRTQTATPFLRRYNNFPLKKTYSSGMTIFVSIRHKMQSQASHGLTNSTAVIMPLICVLIIPTSRIGFLRKPKLTEGYQNTRIIISQDINAKNPQVALSIQQSIDIIVIHITMKVVVAYSNNWRILSNTRCKTNMFSIGHKATSAFH